MNFNIKKTIVAGAFAIYSLGHYRGCQQYYHFEIKEKKIDFGLKEFVLCNTWGIIHGSIYINPSFLGFVLYDEFKKYKMRNDKDFDENKYLSNSYFYIIKK
jgi:hypothetical protein